MVKLGIMGVSMSRADGEDEKSSEVVGNGQRLKILELFAEREKADWILGTSFCRNAALESRQMYYNFL